MSLLRTEFAKKLAASGDLGSLGMKPHAVFIFELMCFCVAGAEKLHWYKQFAS
jgi:hypothetical protein